MPESAPVEFRLELYSDGVLDAAITSKISAKLVERWPVTWDVKVPPRPSFEHPARWHAIVVLPAGETPQSFHRKIEADVLAIDPSGGLRLRTRWDFPQSPNEQEIYELRWKPGTP